MKKTLLCTALLVSSAIFAQSRKDSIKNIEQVEILVKKKLLERKADRMIFNVEASIASQGMDGTETLANVPLVNVDETMGIISIAGKSSVNVMVNGRMLNLSGTALFNYLKSIRSENIARIEVITTPPAKYEAQGNSGLINIILKKNPNLGFSGNITSTLIQRTYSGFSDNGMLNYQTEKFSSSLKLFYYDTAKRSDENYSIVGPTQNYSNTIRRDMGSGLTPSINMSYKISKNSEAGFEYLFSRQKSGMDIVNRTKNISPDLVEENFLTNTFHRGKSPTHTLSAYYDLKLDSLGKKLSLAANFYKDNSNTEVNFSTRKLSDNTVQDVKTISIVEPQVFSAQADLELPFSFGNIETGVKFNRFKNNSDLKYFNLTDNGYVADETRANLFQYQEENYAAYFSYAKNFGAHWEAKAGLRYEETSAKGFTPSTDSGNHYHYGQWFPSAYVAYKKDKNVFTLSYSRRINRPDLGTLNPFRWYSNPYSYSSGNPLLTPSYINNLELGYTFNNKLTASIYYLRVKNAFGQVSYQDGLSQISTYLNYYNNNAFGLNVSYTDTFFKFWESVVAINASAQNSEFFGVNAQMHKGNSLSYSVNNTFSLNKNKTIALFVNYGQNLPRRIVNYYYYNFSDLSSGLKISLMDKQLQINATVTNILAQRSLGDIYFTDRVHHMNHYWDGRSFRLSVTYNFGQKKSIRTKNIRFEEKGRAE
ncbi:MULTISPECIES: outer membrane beta-barrel family protein [Chryseobacterium]|uniref:Outer membrane receptor protein involved in Fe transport n=1 Tax=Chryseobacterium camelliae TaxID=1265445 RepID=A0ABU0TLQ5_9FLAO|nr:MULTISPECIES: outer membrane beta-barrel family protein [Chryseobacterium]MDT3408169.1 outer membrane receptor protein involved in Fe transport [Pseudacidovorax intermedius]MDQ1097976.1 outer membrane receptor protein involved in Fe transport [Chryseobacterium camelliae]MDQ1101905.1 outer membrane receptor protein involved in Fe transport [Chryseobacterium sp. SORGH_AS_1048]MDR6085345.1 outer membrane receptor protein involved in Fe transport [Chryseobacterium sp. SORGH_AS_0909]MDR6129703.1